MVKRLRVGREPEPTAVFCGAEDCGGALSVGVLLMIPTGLPLVRVRRFAFVRKRLSLILSAVKRLARA